MDVDRVDHRQPVYPSLVDVDMSTLVRDNYMADWYITGPPKAWMMRDPACVCITT